LHQTLSLLKTSRFPAIQRHALTTLQVNLGYTCNQSCVHCHVNAGPNRTEQMDLDTIGWVVDVLRTGKIETLDLTGGAPELNSHFRFLVTRARELNVTVIDRCNLTILFEPGQETLAQFLADNQVQVTASLPCYSEDNVDKQRGKGTFDKSIAALKKLNQLGYGKPNTQLALNLVYNPQGAVLPPSQVGLKADYKRFLGDHFGIEFNELFALANMPIQRFGSTLISKGQFESYMTVLRGAHSDGNLESVMCRSTVSVDYQGYLYDCDFNQMLDLPMVAGSNLHPVSGERPKLHLRDLLKLETQNVPIQVADHCFGCTAGQGSSCGGALAG
jgi:radical SAM/Cys-rich protein